MAAITPSNFVIEDIPATRVAGTNAAGTNKRLVRFFATGTVATVNDYLLLSTWIPNASAVEFATVTMPSGGYPGAYIVKESTYGSGSVVPGSAIAGSAAVCITGIVSMT